MLFAPRGSWWFPGRLRRVARAHDSREEGSPEVADHRKTCSEARMGHFYNLKPLTAGRGKFELGPVGNRRVWAAVPLQALSPPLGSCLTHIPEASSRRVLIGPVPATHVSPRLLVPWSCSLSKVASSMSGCGAPLPASPPTQTPSPPLLHLGDAKPQMAFSGHCQAVWPRAMCLPSLCPGFLTCLWESDHNHFTGP